MTKSKAGISWRLSTEKYILALSEDVSKLMFNHRTYFYKVKPAPPDSYSQNKLRHWLPSSRHCPVRYKSHWNKLLKQERMHPFFPKFQLLQENLMSPKKLTGSIKEDLKRAKSIKRHYSSRFYSDNCRSSTLRQGNTLVQGPWQSSFDLGLDRTPWDQIVTTTF